MCPLVGSIGSSKSEPGRLAAGPNHASRSAMAPEGRGSDGSGAERDTAGAMSEENVEIVRRANEEFNRGGPEALIGTIWAPEIVWDMTPAGVPGFGVYSGYDEVRAFMADWFAAFDFDEWELEVEEIIDAGDKVVSFARQRGRGASSGAEVSVDFAQVATVRAGKIIRVDNYLDRSKALEAAGLSE